jgi:hypothetical protein
LKSLHRRATFGALQCQQCASLGMVGFIAHDRLTEKQT